MKKFWFLFLSLAFMTLVACGTKDKATEDSEKKEDKTEETEKTEEKDNKTEEAKKDEEKSSGDNSTTAEYDESKKETSQMKKELPGIDSTIDFVYSDDVLLQQDQKTTVSYEAAGVKDEKEAKEQVDSFGGAETYKNQEGVEYNVDYTDDSYTEIFNVDFTKADLSVVSNIPNDPNITSEKYVSYMMSVDNFKKQGYYLDGEKATEVFRKEADGYLFEISVLHDSNKVLKQTTLNEQTYESLDIPDKATAEKEFADVQAQYDKMNEQDGVNITMEFLDDKFVVNTEMDFENMKDIKKVVSLMNNTEDLGEEDDTHELVQNYSVVASQLLNAGHEHVETKKAE